MTNDDERVAYLAGDGEGTGLDDVTRADLDELLGLLGDDTVWAEPGDHLEDSVVAAITAEAARLPAGGVDGTSAAAPGGVDVGTAGGRAAAPGDARAGRVSARERARQRWSGRRTALTAAAAVVAVAAVGVVVTQPGDRGTEVSLGPTELFPEASGSARVARTDSGWRIELDAAGLPRRDGGRFYQAWLRSDDGTLVAIGTFNEADDVLLWAGVSPVDFPTLTVTEEEADGDESSSGRRVLVGTIELD